MQRRLGRGLGSLLTQPAAQERQGEIHVDRIRPNPFQPRKHFDPQGLEELKNSIEAHGVLQPIVVRAVSAAGDPEAFELISGERRWRAARLAGRETIPAVVRTGVRDDEMLELALVENVQRRDLDPIERARGYRELQESLSLTQEQVAQRVGLQRSTITNHLRLLDLPATIQDGVAEELLSMGHARALLGLKSEPEQLALFETVVRDDLSVREVEKRVRARVQAEQEPAQPRAEPQKDVPPAWVGTLETRLRDSLGTKVRIQNGADYRGQIVIEYYDRDSLEGLLERLSPQPTL